MKLLNKPLDLGSGTPDFIAQPQTLNDALVDVTLNGDFTLHQYTRGYVSFNFNINTLGFYLFVEYYKNSTVC